eukprot:scaffold1_cov402-Prasinococcus_capsulatus_cf.AAC.12
MERGVSICFEREPSKEVNPGFMLIVNPMDNVVLELFKAATAYLMQHIRRFGYLNTIARLPLFDQTLLSAMLQRSALGLEALRVIRRSAKDDISGRRRIEYEELPSPSFETWPDTMVWRGCQQGEGLPEGRLTLQAQHAVSVLGNLEKLRCLERGKGILLDGQIYGLQEIEDAIQPFLTQIADIE